MKQTLNMRQHLSVNLRYYCSSRTGLLKLWVATPFGVAKYNFGNAKQVGLTNQI